VRIISNIIYFLMFYIAEPSQKSGIRLVTKQTEGLLTNSPCNESVNTDSATI